MDRAWLLAAVVGLATAMGACSSSSSVSPGDGDGGVTDDGGGTGGTTGGGNAGTPTTGGLGETGGSGGGGGAGSGGADPSAGPALGEIPAILVDTICVELVDCLGVATIAQVFGDETCSDRFLAGVEDGNFSLLETAVAEGRVTYNPDQVMPCLDSLEGIGCEFSTTRALDQDACAMVFEGSVEVGGVCSVDEECIGDAFCEGATCPRTCTALLAAGEPCNDDDNCQDGLACDEVCFSPANEGEPCGGGVAPGCMEGLICAGDDEDTSQAGTCKSSDEVWIGALGDGCDFDSLTLCEMGLTCVVDIPAGGSPVFSCAEPVSSGAACNFGIPSPCPSGEYCDADITQGVVDGNCVALPGEGEPCVQAPGAAGGCQPGLRCDVDGQCHAVNRIGGSCVSDEGCASGRCAQAVCSRPEECGE